MADLPLRVLLIEDNPGDVRLIQAMLEESNAARGHSSRSVQTEAADRLSTGLQRLEQERFDAVLLDLSLPDAEGLQCVLRVAESAPNVPIVVLSGRDDFEIARHAVHEGAQDYLLKGHVDAELLRRALEYAIERKDLESERTHLLERERSARMEAEMALRIRDQVLGTVSHDLRTPLATVGLFARLLREPDGQHSPSPNRIEWAEKIAAAAQECLAMIGELLDVARLGMGETIELERDSVELVGLVQEVVAERQSRATQHQIVVETSAPEIRGRWDRARLRRVVANLLSNATKYSAPGSRVWVSVASRQTADPPQASVMVRDEGVGIPSADLASVFDWYHRARNVGSVPGTGIGLAGARRIVELHGGTISVSSTEGAGSTFTVDLPLQPR
ncbi:MAG TPA: hybrid sensor histidine kinase/response regulator [Chloroflexota bacterium]